MPALKWDYDQCHKEALKYARKVDFRKNSHGAYLAAFRKGWLDKWFTNITEIEGEEWKDVEGYEEFYQISNLGRVKSKQRYKILSPRKDGCGYQTVLLCANNTQKNVKIHKMVAKAFLPNPNNYREINHKDENKENNTVGNLEWCDRTYNVSYSIGRAVEQYDKSGNFIAEYKTIAEAKRMTNVPDHIHDCCTGKRNFCGGYIWKFKK